MTPSMNPMIEGAWRRLQALSIEHGHRIGPHYNFNGWYGKGRIWHRQTTPDPIIKENAEILGRGDETEIKARIHWYIVFHPSVFDATSKMK